MPVEHVLGATKLTNPKPGLDVPHGEPDRVMVGWGKHRQSVQIGVDNNNPFVFNEHRDALARGDVEATMDYQSLWMDLPDRKSINDLIRLLRKARDDAYGRDE